MTRCCAINCKNTPKSGHHLFRNPKNKQPIVNQATGESEIAKHIINTRVSIWVQLLIKKMGVLAIVSTSKTIILRCNFNTLRNVVFFIVISSKYFLHTRTKTNIWNKISGLFYQHIITFKPQNLEFSCSLV